MTSRTSMKNLIFTSIAGGALMAKVFADGGCAAATCPTGTECIEVGGGEPDYYYYGNQTDGNETDYYYYSDEADGNGTDYYDYYYYGNQTDGNGTDYYYYYYYYGNQTDGNETDYYDYYYYGNQTDGMERGGLVQDNSADYVNCVPVTCEAPDACPNGFTCEAVEVECFAAPCPQFACVPKE